MTKPYRVTAYARLSNAINASLVRMGIPMGNTSLLTVRGRKSGKPIQTPVSIFVQGGKRYLIAPYGVVNWVRNLRAPVLPAFPQCSFACTSVSPSADT